jgi:hypothetical protein
MDHPIVKKKKMAGVAVPRPVRFVSFASDSLQKSTPVAIFNLLI